MTMLAEIQTYEDLKTYIQQIYNEISASNYREQKDKLIQIRGTMALLQLDRDQRQEINQLIDDCFVSIHCLRDQEQHEFEEASRKNYERLLPMVQEAIAMVKSGEDTRSSWDFCIRIQDEFRGIKLKKELRESLYNQLQEAFTLIKAGRDEKNKQYTQEAINSYNRLKPIVDSVFERAQTSMEFKKTREALKRVQGEFKGIRMKAEDRQSLYSKLQTAFDTLHQRQDEYYEAKKDKIELHVNYQLSDLELRLEDIEKDIDKDIVRINELKETESNLLQKGSAADPSHDIHNQLMLLKASIARKEEMLEELLEQKARVQQKKEKWEE
jgi:hypothetical protein